MAKKNKSKKGGNKKKGPQKQDASTSDGVEIHDVELVADMLNLSEEEKQQVRANAARQKQVADNEEEEEFESTEDKARSDMEQCEKLLGIKDTTDKTYEERKERLEEEKKNIQETFQEREREEIKRINKKNKKTLKEGDMIFYDKRLSDDKKLKSLYDLVMRAFKEQQMIKETKFDQMQRIEKINTEIDTKNRNLDKTIQSKHMLHSLFQSLKEKNIEAYRMKDEAIKDQQVAKKEMTKMFEKEIDSVTVNYQEQLDIKSDYEKKKKELEKIAEEYKKLEKESKSLLEQKEKRITDLQAHINDKIDKELKVLMDKFNFEKTRYDKLTSEREQLNNQYKDLKDKFQKYLSEIEASDSKIKIYAAEIDSLQKKIKEIVDSKDDQDETLQQLNSMDENIASLQKKIETFQKLKFDLEKQL